MYYIDLYCILYCFTNREDVDFIEMWINGSSLGVSSGGSRDGTFFGSIGNNLNFILVHVNLQKIIQILLGPLASQNEEFS